MQIDLLAKIFSKTKECLTDEQWTHVLATCMENFGDDPDPSWIPAVLKDKGFDSKTTCIAQQEEADHALSYFSEWEWFQTRSFDFEDNKEGLIQINPSFRWILDPGAGGHSSERNLQALWVNFDRQKVGRKFNLQEVQLLDLVFEDLNWTPSQLLLALGETQADHLNSGLNSGAHLEKPEATLGRALKEQWIGILPR